MDFLNYFRPAVAERTRTIAALLSCSLILFNSCNKDLNPAPEKHTDAEFRLILTETRQGKDFIWEMRDGKPFCEEQRLRELWVTGWNDCLLLAEGLEEGFDGVNFSSSDPGKVRIEKIDSYRCHLRYIADSPEGISIHAEAGSKTHSFQLFSKERIEPEGISLSIGGRELHLDFNPRHKYPYIYDGQPVSKHIKLGKNLQFYVWYDEGKQEIALYDGDKPWEGEVLEIGELIPENASFRHVVNWISRHDGGDWYNGGVNCVLREDFGPWPQGGWQNSEGFTGLDWSEVQGRKVTVLRPGLLSGFFILKDSKLPDPSKKILQYGSYEILGAMLRAEYDFETIQGVPPAGN